MTTNQLMVLLDIHRGTFIIDRHMGTVENDLLFLIERGFIIDKDNITTTGTNFVLRAINKIPNAKTIEAMEETDEMIRRLEAGEDIGNNTGIV